VGLGTATLEGQQKRLAWMLVAGVSVFALIATSPATAQEWRQGHLASDPDPLPRGDSAPVQLAQETGEERFDIPPGDLQAALLAFSQQAGLQLLYAAELTAGLRTEGVSGVYRPEQALDLLLAGTGLTYTRSAADTIALSRLPEADEAGSITLGPIVVTGERVERSLRDTASSVAVFDAEDIEDRPGLDSTNDLMGRIANVTTSGTGNLAPAVRGVDGTGPAQGADAFFAGTRPRLNVQVDGRALSYNEVVFGDVSLWDVEQVEVLRGPQSTLQGRNSIAGTVVVKTKDPTYDFEAGGRAVAGGLDTRQTAAFVSGPIIEDQLAFRLAVDRQTSESNVHFEPYRGFDPEEFESTNLRAKLLIEPEALDSFSALVTVNHTDTSGPQAEFVRRPFEDHVGSDPNMAIFAPRATSGTIDTTWDLSDNITLETTASLSDTHVERHAAPGFGNVELDGREYVVEPRVRFFGLDGRLNGVGGVYLFRASQDEEIDFPAFGTFDDRTTTVAAFGEATYAILEDVDLTVGARAERERRERTGAAGIFSIDLDETYTAFLPKFGLAWHATDELTVGAMVSRGYNGGGAGFTYNPPFESYTFDPEYVWTYEAYARADLLDNRLSLTGNVFYSDYKDMQLAVDLNPDPTLWAVVVRNADKAVTYGAEVGARWLAAPGLELFADVGLLKTEITDYPDSGVEGNELPQAPAFTSNFGVVYKHSSGIELSADARYSDAYFSSISNDPRGKIDPYFIVNSKLSYRFAEEWGDVRVFAFVQNVFDTEEPIYLEPGATPADDVANLLPPRTFGVGLEMRF
jgi:iron complex outermembrane recepter protein